MGHDRAQRAIDVSERMRNAARAKRTAVSAQRATVAAAASPRLQLDVGGAHKPRVTLLLAGVGWLHLHVAPRPLRVRAAAATGGLRLTWLLTAARYHSRFLGGEGSASASPNLLPIKVVRSW